VLGCTSFFASQGMLVRADQLSSISEHPLNSYPTQSQLPDCDMTDNSTGTVVPAYPPDGTQCLAMPSNLCTYTTRGLVML
jgi:hypothetical protein